VPALPKTEVPIIPKTEVPALPKLEIPAFPKTEVPTLPKLEIPALPKSETIPLVKPVVTPVPETKEVQSLQKPEESDDEDDFTGNLTKSVHELISKHKALKNELKMVKQELQKEKKDHDVTKEVAARIQNNSVSYVTMLENLLEEEKKSHGETKEVSKAYEEYLVELYRYSQSSTSINPYVYRNSNDRYIDAIINNYLYPHY
jgi:hypothetical protein